MKEGWENVFYWGFLGGLFAAGVAYAYKPDTSYVFFPFPSSFAGMGGRVAGWGLMMMCECSIQTWALEEARRRLEAEGILEDPSSTGASKHKIRTVSGLGPGGKA